MNLRNVTRPRNGWFTVSDRLLHEWDRQSPEKKRRARCGQTGERWAYFEHVLPEKGWIKYRSALEWDKPCPRCFYLFSPAPPLSRLATIAAQCGFHNRASLDTVEQDLLEEVLVQMDERQEAIMRWSTNHHARQLMRWIGRWQARINEELKTRQRRLCAE